MAKKENKQTKKPFYKKVWFWVLAVLLVGIFGNMGGESESKTNEQTKVEQKESIEATKKETEKEEKKEAKKETQKPKEEPKESYELIDDIAVFTSDKELVFGVNQHLESFSYDMTQALKETHSEIKNGAIFRDISALTDTYGNEEKTTTVVVYYSQETIEAINYDNWPTLDSSGLFDTADATWIHYALKDSKFKNNTPSDTNQLPDLYYSMQGAVHE